MRFCNVMCGMSKRAKQILLIVAVQTTCLAVGLWMQQHYILSSVVHAAMKRAQSALESDAASLLIAVDEGEVARLIEHPSANEQFERLLRGHLPGSGDVMIVDSLWRPIFPADATIGSDKVEFEHIPDYQARTARKQHALAAWRPGRIKLSNAERLALVRALPDRNGYIIVHQSVAEIRARATGLVDSLPTISFVTLVWMFVLLSIAVYMILARLHDDMDQQRSRAASEALRQAQSLIRTRDAVIFGLAKLADSRDPETGDHLERISVYSTILASALARDPRYQKTVTPTFVRLIGISSALHDIGKVGVEDRILRKPGPLTPEEYATMQIHTTIGGDCLREIERRLGSSNFLQFAREIALTHHENWDGTGYPRGLAGTNIPLPGRVVAIADVYDALSSKRVYKSAFPHEKCVEIIRSDAGKKFDADLVEVWLGVEAKFRLIAQQIATRSDTRKPKQRSIPEADGDSERNFDELCLAASETSGEQKRM